MRIVTEPLWWSTRSLLLAVFIGSLSFGATVSPAQIGGGTCSTAMVSGTYFYLLDGAIVSGQSIAYAELGKIVADGQGNLYGSSFASGGGQQARSTLSGTYSVRPNCTGTITQAGGTVTFQVINSGQGMVFAVSQTHLPRALHIDKLLGPHRFSVEPVR
jgi:hypothetical protein